MPEWLQIAGLVLRVSLVLQVFALGLGTKWTDATYLFRRPSLLWRSILARNVAAPLITILLIQAFSLRGPMAITLAILTVTPVPPLLPRSLLKAGGRAEYILGLLVSHAILAIILVPVTGELMAWALGGAAHFSALQVAKLVGVTILLPIGAGMLAARRFSKLKNFAPNLLMVGSVLLIAGMLPLLPVAFKAFGALAGNGAILALILFILAGTAIGHFLGGPVPEDRTVLAIATASRHPGLAFAIAKANFPEQGTLIAGAVLIYLILRLILAVPYMRARRNASRHTQRPHVPVHLPPGLAGRHR